MLSRRGFLKVLGVGVAAFTVNPISLFESVTITPVTTTPIIPAYISITKYGDISPRTAAYCVKELLKQAEPHLLTSSFGEAKPLSKATRKTIRS